MRVIIVAAGQGTRLRPLTDDRPKCMVEVGGRTLLDWQIDAICAAGLRPPVVVGGHRADQLPSDRVRVLMNPDHATTNMVHTLFCAEEEFGEGFVLAYGDIAYAPAVLRQLVSDPAPVGVVVDREWRRYWERRFDDPLGDAESLRVGAGGLVDSIGQREANIERIEAQYIGLVAFKGEGVVALRRGFAQAADDERAGRTPFNCGRSLAKMYMTDLLQGLVSLGVPVTAVPIHGGWIEVDSHRDLAIASELIAGGRLNSSSTSAC